MGTTFSGFSVAFAESLVKLPMSDHDRHLVTARFIPLVTREETNYKWNYFAYMILTNVITIGGVLTVAFSSFNQLGTDNDITYAFGWTVWGIGVAITLASKWMTQFNTSKKYILGMASLEKLQTEGWSFLGGTGRYDDPDMNHRTKTFLVRIEKLRVKSMELMPEAESNSAFKDILAGGATSFDNASNSIIAASSAGIDAAIAQNVNSIVTDIGAAIITPPRTTHNDSPLVSDDDVVIHMTAGDTSAKVT